jgi:single-strand DNA-binding protein
MNTLHAIGRLTREAKLSFTADGKPVVNFSLAVDVGWGERKHTVYYGCSLWRNPEAVHPYLTKGKQIGVTGEPDLRLWESDGKHGAEITVNCSDVTLLGNKGDTEQPAEPKSQGGFRQSGADEGDRYPTDSSY